MADSIIEIVSGIVDVRLQQSISGSSDSFNDSSINFSRNSISCLFLFIRLINKIHCLGKIQCQTCQRFVDKSDLRLDGKKCKICISQVQCKRCMNYVDEDNAYRNDCIICKGRSKCEGECNSWFIESELTDGYCSIC